MRLTESVIGTVRMTDGTHRAACKNTYRNTITSADGGLVHEDIVRIEFILYTNRANGSGRKWRKTTEKQAMSFTPNSQAD